MNKYAVSAEQVGSGLTKMASTLAMDGTTIQQATAMLTGGTEITQDSDKMGNAIKILSLRLRGKLKYASLQRNLYALLFIVNNIDDNYICQSAKAA